MMPMPCSALPFRFDRFACSKTISQAALCLLRDISRLKLSFNGASSGVATRNGSSAANLKPRWKRSSGKREPQKTENNGSVVVVVVVLLQQVDVDVEGLFFCFVFMRYIDFISTTQLVPPRGGRAEKTHW